MGGDRRLEWRHLTAVVNDDNTITVKNVLNDAREHLGMASPPPPHPPSYPPSTPPPPPPPANTHDLQISARR